jgi:ankyrin repeat protein
MFRIFLSKTLSKSLKYGPQLGASHFSYKYGLNHSMQIRQFSNSSNDTKQGIFKKFVWQPLSGILSGKTFDDSIAKHSEIVKPDTKILTTFNINSFYEITQPYSDKAFRDADRAFDRFYYSYNNTKYDINAACELTRKTMLHYCAENGYLDFVKKLLWRDADINAEDNEGNTPLNSLIQKVNWMQTAKYDLLKDEYQEIIDKLLEYGADVNKPNKNGFSPFLVSCKGSDESIFKQLLKHANIINVDENYNPLFIAAISKETSKFDVILNFYKNHNISYNAANLVLHTFLAKHINEYMIDRLIDIFYNLDVKDENGDTLLHLYCKNYEEDYYNVITTLIKKGLYINETNLKGNTPLMEACLNGSTDFVESLLQHRAKVNFKNAEGDTALLFAIEDNNLTIATRLLEQGANPNAENSNDDTPLHIAARKGNIDAVKLLLKSNANQDSINNKGNLPLHEASKYGCYEIISFLEKGNYLSEQNKDGDTPLHLAVKKSSTCTLTLLKDNSNSIIIQNNDGDSFLHIAARENKEKLFKKIYTLPTVFELAIQQCLFIKNNDGNTPLHIAVQKASLSVIEYMLKHGADVNDTNMKGKTPLIFAAERGDTAFADVLLENGANLRVIDNLGFDAEYYARINNHKSLIRLFEDYKDGLFQNHQTFYIEEIKNSAQTQFLKSELVKAEETNDSNYTSNNPNYSTYEVQKIKPIEQSKLVENKTSNKYYASPEAFKTGDALDSFVSGGIGGYIGSKLAKLNSDNEPSHTLNTTHSEPSNITLYGGSSNYDDDD